MSRRSRLCTLRIMMPPEAALKQPVRDTLRFLPGIIGRVLIAGLFFLSAAVIWAERLPIKTYTVADGLLRDEVEKIKQDSRGFLWFCTAEGVSRFDGYGFTNFTAKNGLPDPHVHDFLETRSGEIYIATGNGLAKLNSVDPRNPQSQIQPQQTSLFTVYLPENPQARRVQVLFEDQAGTIFVGTSDGLYQINAENKLEAVNLGKSRAAEPQISVTAIIQDRRGALWLGTEGSGLLRVAADGKIRQFIASDGLPGNLIASLLEDRDGNLWAGMRLPATAGVALLNGEAGGSPQTPIVRRAFGSADGLPSHWVPSIYQASNGRLWLGTIAGLCEWQGEAAKSVCRTYTSANDLCDKDVWSVAEDKGGNLWTGSRCGAKKWAQYGFTAYDERDGIEAVQTNSIFENRIGQLFAVVRKDGTRTIYRFKADGKFTGVRPRLPPETNYFGWGWKQTAWQDSSGAWLIPNGLGLFRFAPRTKFESLAGISPQKFSPATKGSDVFRVFEDSRGDIWIATTYGGEELWRWERGANLWHDLTAEIIAGPPRRLVSSFVEDRSGNLWIGTGADTGAELLRYRAGQFRIFTAADGLPDGWIRDLYVDRAGRLWIANSKNGLLRLDDVNAEQANFVRYSTNDGLSSAGANCLTEDAFGRIYIGGGRGVDRLNPATGQIENFTTTDGLPSSFVEVAYRDRQNNLWFGTAKGLTKYVPEPERKRQMPTILLTGLRVGGESQPISILGEAEIPEREFNSDQRQITVDFVGLGASLGESLKYEYRLGDAAWTRTTERTVNFANLAAGAYQFEVRAATADQIYSHPALFSFRIAAPVWQRPWFLALLLILTATAGYGVYRARVARLLAMERVRTRIATDLHDDIGANLTKISVLSEVAKQKLRTGGNGAPEFNGGNLLENIAETSRESVSAMSDIVWAINPRKDSLADLTSRMRRHAEEILEQQGISLQFDSTVADLRLTADVRRNIYLIFKESLNNIVRHSQATVVKISFNVWQTRLVLLIADDGDGFEMTTATEGNGLASMEKRVAELGGKLQITSTPGDGATINLQIELKRKLWRKIRDATRQNMRGKK